MGNLRKYLEKHLALTQADKTILDGLVLIEQKKGAHALISEREYLRLAKNISVETALLILTKFEMLKQEEK